MKKWLVLLLSAGVLTVALLFQLEETPVEVKAVQIVPQSVEQTVTCTGLVEAADSMPLVLPFSCVMERVEAKEGQRVQKGDLLAVVDKEATRDVVAAESLLSLAAIDTEITAPADGVVMTVEAVPGETLAAGVPCAVLVCDRDLQVRIAIPEKHLRDLEQGMAARITGSGFSEALYTGTLDEIAATAQSDLGGGTVVQGVVSLDVPDASMRVGLNARVTLVTAVDKNALVIPFEAVQSDASGDYVYVVRDGCVHRRNLTDTTQTGKGVWVTHSDLEGAVVVTQPEKITRDGQPVREVLA